MIDDDSDHRRHHHPRRLREEWDSLASRVLAGRFGHGGGGRHGGRGPHRGGFGLMGDDDGLPRGRKLGADDLQLLLLLLVSEAPSHGYELIRRITERSGGFYAPSPGMVYPALTFLDEIGHVAAEAEGNRKLYAITAGGEAHLAENRARADAIAALLARIGSRMDGVRDAFAGVAGPDADAYDELHRARHRLRDALASRRGAGVDEARRIARLLEAAAADILKGPAS